MELKGKKANFLGDSITHGVGASAPEHQFVDIVAREGELAAARNYGISCTHLACRPSAPDGESDKNFCARAARMDPDADLVVVFGGTNDFCDGDTPVGTPEDRTRFTFYGACHELMRTLIERYPRAAVVFMTPTPRENSRCPNPLGLMLPDYADIIRETARQYALPVLDLYGMCGFQPDIPSHKELYCPDGLHPSDAGHRIIAGRLLSFLRSL